MNVSDFPVGQEVMRHNDIARGTVTNVEPGPSENLTVITIQWHGQLPTYDGKKTLGAIVSAGIKPVKGDGLAVFDANKATRFGWQGLCQRSL